MINRREVFLGGLLNVIFMSGSCGCVSAQEHTYSGCVPSPQKLNNLMDHVVGGTIAAATGNEPIISSSGDRNLDRALAETLSMLSSELEVHPGFAFYDDFEGKNAYATGAVRLNGADGTVLFGLSFLRDMLTMPEAPDAAVAAVCAHEFGHILQFKLGLFDIVNSGMSNVKRSELQADCLAGYFAGKRKLARPGFPAAVFAVTQHTMGDNMFDHPGHHGTAEERSAAVVFGFDLAFNQKASLAQTIEATTSYVTML